MGESSGEDAAWHDYDCGEVGGGFPHPASAHEGRHSFYAGRCTGCGERVSTADLSGCPGGHIGRSDD